jgi:hypothetical protein
MLSLLWRRVNRKKRKNAFVHNHSVVTNVSNALQCTEQPDTVFTEENRDIESNYITSQSCLLDVSYLVAKEKKTWTVSLRDNGVVELPLSCETLINICVAIATSASGARKGLRCFCRLFVNGWIGGRNDVQTNRCSVAFLVRQTFPQTESIFTQRQEEISDYKFSHAYDSLLGYSAV